jgi:hypothetical protein
LGCVLIGAFADALRARFGFAQHGFGGDAGAGDDLVIVDQRCVRIGRFADDCLCALLRLAHHAVFVLGNHLRLTHFGGQRRADLLDEFK